MEISNTSEFDFRCSNACTRAGLAALLLSAIAIALLQPIEKTKQLNAVLTYYGNRISMADALNMLKEDKVWNFLLERSNETKITKEGTLGQLLEYEVLYDGKSLRLKSEKPKVEPQRTESKKSPSAVSPLAAPSIASPTNLTVTVDRKILVLHHLVTALTELGKGDTLSLARQYSNQHNRSIFWWARLRNSLIQNTAREGKALPHFEPASRFDVPDVPREVLLKLNIPQIAELANYQPVRENELDPLLKEQSSMTVPTVGIPLTTVRAASLVEMALVLMALYFWLYYREAKASDSFPAPATLFAVFGRTRLSRVIFELLIFVPPTAAGLLASKSLWFTPWNFVPAALVVLIGSMIMLEGTPTFKAREQC